ncbi:1-deoxy-D-xylulose-5-phosphate synthase N-terminal domain-containing protein [uncultured Clostridium sp.]|uniref:1-deoxy-D-xylulose-5-phosphate synthase N-terminal domain-containing protein n=1 Tax=uncultured Clostridium sp. TaxID=59620 RepID=UPI0025F80D0D|nr:1-deoxy-D-xylulose-5-phosphate synthase N-terminal domain-containing protein [uncultured Clostridium sp.]
MYENEEIKEKIKEARKLIIDMAATPTGCHIGGSLSVIDILMVTYFKYLEDKSTKIVLSKGHAAAALYATLYLNKLIDVNPVEVYGRKDSIFTGHPNHKIDNISFSTGSLGHGISYAVGCALAEKLKGSNGLGIAICGDGELQEGLCWETFQIVQAKNINNFICIVDVNECQNDGFVKDISPMKNLKSRFEALDFDVKEIDGHNIEEILLAIKSDRKRPIAVLAKTIKGKGIKVMEGNPECHYAKISSRLAAKWKVML